MKKNNDKNNDKNKKKKDEKTEAKKIEKNYIELKTEERANLKQFAKRKFISVKALKQIHALLLFDNKKTMTEVMEELAVSPQTLNKWREQFEEKRMGSLLVVLEKKKDDDDEKDDGNTDNDELNSAE